jgi:hypothetical protein
MTFEPDGLSRPPMGATSNANVRVDRRQRHRVRRALALLDHQDDEWMPESLGLSAEHVIRELFDNDYDIS